MHNPLDLTGRTILVTGASSGLGRATSVLLSKLGARLVLGPSSVFLAGSEPVLGTEGSNALDCML